MQNLLQKCSLLAILCLAFSLTLFAQPTNDNCDVHNMPTLIDVAANQASCTTTSGTTVNATANYPLSCSTNGTTVSDVWYHLTNTVNYEDGITVEVTNFSGNGNIGVAIFALLGQTCAEASTEGSFNELDCVLTTNGNSVSSAYFSNIPATDDIFHIQIVVWSEGNNPSDQGTFDLCVYANPTQPDEICDNQIDDDNDGDVDCDDSDCGKPFIFQATEVAHPTCPSLADGTITVYAGGNNLEYRLDGFDWVTTNVFENLSPGIYTGSVRNAQTGCFINFGTTLNSMSCPTPEGTDECTPAPEVGVNAPTAPCNVFARADNTNATASTNNGNPCGFSFYQGGDLWFKFVAPTTGIVRFQPLENTWQQNYGVAIYNSCNETTFIDCDSGFGDNFVNFTNLTSGNTYYLRLWEHFGVKSGILEFCLNALTPPANDECTTATSIVEIATTKATCTNYTGDNSNASDSAPINGTPACNSYDGGDIWYQFTAPSTGDIKILVAENNWSVLAAAIYDDCNATTEVACDAYFFADGGRHFTFTNLIPQHDYYLRLWDSNNNQFGPIEFCIAEIPTNDDCSAAVPALTINTPASGTPVTTSTSLIGATEDAAPSCSSTLGIWYQFVAPFDGEVNLQVTTPNGGSLPRISIYDDCGGNEVFCTFQSSNQDVTNLTPNATYYLMASTFHGSENDINLKLSGNAQPPANDECSNATPLTLNDCKTTIYTNAGSTPSANLPTTNCYEPTTADVWFSITVPATGQLEIETAGGDVNTIFDSAFEVFTGDCNNLVYYNCGNDIDPIGDPPNQHDLLSIDDPNLANQTLYIRVLSNQSEVGTFNVCAYEPCTPPKFAHTLTLDCNNETFAVSVEVISLGSATAADIIFTGGNVLNVQANMTYALGDFPVDNPIDIELVDQNNAACFAATYGVIATCTTPGNDDVCNAIDLSELISTGNNIDYYPYSNLGATVQANEVRPRNIDGNCETYDDWCDGTVGGAAGLEHSVWFSFIAPAGGFLIVSTRQMNTQIAVWEAANCTDLLTTNALMVVANDDVFAGETGSEVFLDCLIPNQRYYIQVDGYEGAQGTFDIGIQHINNGPPSCNILTNSSGQDIACNSLTIFAPPSEGYGNWLPINDDQGNLIMALNDKGQVLGNITLDMMLNGDGVRFADDLAYLDRNWSVSTQNTFTNPICLRFFFSEAELNALGAVDNFVDNVNKLGFSKWSAATCGDYPTTGTLTQLNATKAGLLSTGIYFIDVEVEDLSAFYLHSNAGILPLELVNFSAFANKKRNEIYWTTATERNISRFELQRSADGKNDWASIEKVAAQGFSYENYRYQVIDNQPFSHSFYRLKIVEYSGAVEYSNTIQIQNSHQEKWQVIPNPAHQQISVIGLINNLEEATLTLYDVFGQIQLRQEITPNQAITIEHLTAGTYWINIQTSTRTYAQKLLIQK